MSIVRLKHNNDGTSLALVAQDNGISMVMNVKLLDDGRYECVQTSDSESLWDEADRVDEWDVVMHNARVSF